MIEIRPLEPDDLPAAVALFDRMLGAEQATASGMIGFFRRALFDHPWADPELSSQAAIEDGRLVGFLASHARRLRFDTRPLRLAVVGPLVVAPDAGHPALGALLARRYLHGPQDLTVTDGATPLMRAIWERLGGETAHLRCIEWVLPLRPVSLAASYWRLLRGGALPPAGRSPRVPAALDRIAEPPVRAAGRLAAQRAGLTPAPVRSGSAPVSRRAGPVTVEPLTARGLVDHLPALTQGRRLAPEYDVQFAEWLFAELAAVRGRGQLVPRVVRDGRHVIGLYLYYLQRNGMSAVIALVGADERSTARVLDALVEDARRGGAAGLSGRVETDVLEPLVAAGAFLAYRGCAVIHGSDPALVALATSPHALLTRLEGEYWMAPEMSTG